MPLAILLVLLACDAASALRVATLRTQVQIARAPAPTANLFENLGKIADYSSKWAGNAIAAMGDDRSAAASHILSTSRRLMSSPRPARILPNS